MGPASVTDASSTHPINILNWVPVPSSSILGPVEPRMDAKMSSSASYHSQDSESTAKTSLDLAPVQLKDNHKDLNTAQLDGPADFDSVVAAAPKRLDFTLEERSDLLFSTEHLKTILSDPSSLHRFTSFLSSRRPASIPTLTYYLDTIKAIKAISYANAISETLEPLPGFPFTQNSPKPVLCTDLEEKASTALAIMVHDDLPAFITYIYANVVAQGVSRRITDTLSADQREVPGGLAEVFCLTDPSKPDNPIIFASEEFHRMTQYGRSYAVGRNCRFLQGEKTSRFSTARLRRACEAGKEHCEVFLNYRRDGTSFMNLLMMAPLFDSRGRLRYFIGAQVDVSNLVKDCTDLESLGRLIEQKQKQTGNKQGNARRSKGEFQALSEMLNGNELETVRRWGGHMHSDTHHPEDHPSMASTNFSRPRVPHRAGHNDRGPMSPPLPSPSIPISGRLAGVYHNYLLVRPFPSLQVVFASPSLHVPGLLQTPFLSRIGGSERVRKELAAALADGRGVTAKIRWLSRPDAEGHWRWVHCTPLLGANRQVGVWMMLLVDDENDMVPSVCRKAPPVAPHHDKFMLEQTGAQGWSEADTPKKATKSKSIDGLHHRAHGTERRKLRPVRRGSLEILRQKYAAHDVAEDGGLKSPMSNAFNLTNRGSH